MYQIFYEKVISELKGLDEKLVELDVKRQNAKADYDKIEENLGIKENLLIKLTNKRDDMPYRNHFLISFYAGVLAVSIAIGGIVLYLFGLTKLLMLFPVFINKLQPLVVLILILGILGNGLICGKLVDKIQKKLENRSKNKIINSDEYKKLLDEIDVLSNELIFVREDVGLKEKDYSFAKIEYDTCKKMQDEKRVLAEYIAKQINGVETTIYKSKSHKRDCCSGNTSY